MDFFENRVKYEKKTKLNDFVDAMKKVDAFIRNPTTNRMDVGTHITVKHEIEPVFKQEVESEPFEIVNIQRNSSNVLDNLTQINKLQQELLEKNLECESLKRKHQTVKAEMENVKRKYQSSRNEIEQLLRKNETTQREIDYLSHENKLLTAQLKKLKTCCEVENVKPKNSENLFEVETLLKHRIVRGKMSFLVRWKSYGPEHDSWVDQSDLRCEKMLKTYLKSKGM